ncbi:MAG: protein kinase, partial [Myxococcota bacterium]
MLSDNERSSGNVDSLRAWVPVLRHPGLVDVLGVNEPGERPYLVLGMPEGVPMGRIVARYGRYDAAAFANIGAQLLSTVGYLHDRGLVHGDLHVDNIYINGNDPRTAKVTVAGAHRCGRADRLTAVDDQEQTRLAPLPEERPLDPRDDVYALGTLLESVLELTADTFDGSDLLHVRLRALCNRCRSSTRSRRPANAGELLGAFSECFGRLSTEIELPALPDTPTRVLSTGTVNGSFESTPSTPVAQRPTPRPIALTVPAPPPPLRPAAATIPMPSPVAPATP